jgi:hypothetical protein
MRGLAFAALATALPLAACASNVKWMKDGATTADFEMDKRQCVYQANLATPGTPAGYTVGSALAAGITDGVRLAQLQQQCMEARGWNRIVVKQTAETTEPADETKP